MLTHYGHWLDLTGQKQEYFDGANYGKGAICECHAQNNCRESHVNHTCNCDVFPHLPNTWLRDGGTITNSSALPISAVTYTNLPPASQAQFRVGPLICEGEKVDENPPGTSCAALRAAGVKSSGYYSLKKNSSFYLQFCDMTKPNDNETFETTIGSLMVQSHAINGFRMKTDRTYNSHSGPVGNNQLMFSDVKTYGNVTVTEDEFEVEESGEYCCSP